jgi:hypothetical protein
MAYLCVVTLGMSNNASVPLQRALAKHCYCLAPPQNSGHLSQVTKPSSSCPQYCQDRWKYLSIELLSDPSPPKKGP